MTLGARGLCRAVRALPTRNSARVNTPKIASALSHNGPSSAPARGPLRQGATGREQEKGIDGRGGRVFMAT